MAAKKSVVVQDIIFLAAVLLAASRADALQVGYYNQRCPKAEHLVAATVYKHFLQNQTIPAGLIRLHFHDCFVRGCDASLLLDVTPTGEEVEKDALPNKNSVRGYEIIDDAKATLNRECGNVVSCADIVALAARDSVYLTSGYFYQVPTGRYDGRTSLSSEVIPNLVGFTLTAEELKAKFRAKGLNTHDLVVLSGGHTLGRSVCAAFRARLYNFSGTNRPDPTLSPSYLTILRGICTTSSDVNPRVPLDKGTEFVFDNSYYAEILRNNGLLQTDQELLYDSETGGTIRDFARDNANFLLEFGKSMVKMGNVEVKTARDGEIRTRCGVPNNIRLSGQ